MTEQEEIYETYYRCVICCVDLPGAGRRVHMDDDYEGPSSPIRCTKCMGVFVWGVPWLGFAPIHPGEWGIDD